MRRLAAVLLMAMLALCVGCQAEGGEVAYVDGVESVEILTEGAWEWSPDDDCALCHPSESETTATDLCEIRQSEGTCLSCHASESALRTVHELPFDSQSPTKLKDTAVDSGMCAECHGVGGPDPAEAAQVMLTDTEGTSIDPHNLPEAGDHNEIECLDCHKTHQPSVEDSAQALCESCHHQGVFECYTCHS